MAQPSWRRGAGCLLLQRPSATTGSVLGSTAWLVRRPQLQARQPMAAFASESSPTERGGVDIIGTGKTAPPMGAAAASSEGWRDGATARPRLVRNREGGAATAQMEQLEALARAVAIALKRKDLNGAVSALCKLDQAREQQARAGGGKAPLLLKSGQLTALVELCDYVRGCKGRNAARATEALLEILELETIALDDRGLGLAIRALHGPEEPAASPTVPRLLAALARPQYQAKATPPVKLYMSGIRQAADAGRPQAVARILQMARAVPSDPPLQQGSAGTQFSPRWHLLRAHVAAGDVDAALALLKEEGPALRLDKPTLQLLLKELWRQRRGQAAARALVWAEEVVGLEADVDSYNLVLIALTRERRTRRHKGMRRGHWREQEEGGVVVVGQRVTTEEMFERMRARGVQPNQLTFGTVVDACAERRDAAGALRAFAEMVFTERFRPNDITFGALMKAFSRAGRWQGAVACLEMMRDLGLPLRDIIYGTVIIACARAGQVDAALRFYDQARARGGDGKPGAPLNAMIYASAMYACSKVGRHDEALEIFAQMHPGRQQAGAGAEAAAKTAPITFAYNLAMQAHVLKGEDARAVVLFDLLSAQRLDDPSLRPDPDTCKAVLRPLARAGRLDDGLALVEEVLASPQGAYVSRYPLALFVLHAVRVGQGPRVAGRLAGMLEAHEKDLQSALAGALALAFAQGGDLSQALPLALGALSEEAAEGDDAALQRWMAGAFLSVAAAKAPPASDGSWPLLLYLRDVLAAAAAGGEEENAALAAAMEAVYHAAPAPFRHAASQLHHQHQAPAAAAAAINGKYHHPPTTTTPTFPIPTTYMEEPEPLTRVSAGGRQ